VFPSDPGAKHSEWLLDTAGMSGVGESTAGAPWYRQVAVVVVAVALAAAWVLVDHPLEGPVVMSLSSDHGIHLTDPLAIIPLVWAWRTVARGRA